MTFDSDGFCADCDPFGDSFDCVCESAESRRADALATHIDHLWNHLSPNSRSRLACLAASTITNVEDVEHARLLAAFSMIADAEGVLDEERTFAETYLGTEWICEAIADADRRRTQVREAVQRYRERDRIARAKADKRAGRQKERQNTARTEALMSARAIAMDGEGMTLEDGSHVYRYMAATDSDGTLLGELEDDRGIMTGSALDFIAGLPKQDERGEKWLGVFGYGFGYDLTKMLEDLGDKGLYLLFHEGGKKEKIRFLGYRLRRIGQCFEVVESKAASGQRQTKVWDILKGFQSTFVKALEAWSVGTPEERAHLAKMKKQRGNFVDSDWDEVRGYCRDECRLLAKLTEEYIQAHIEAGIDLRGKYHGAGSTADAFLTMLNALAKKATYEIADGDDILAYLRMRQAFSKAFFGGRAEVSSIGVVRGPVWMNDVASAYPHILYELRCVRHGKWKWLSEKGMRRAKDTARMACISHTVDVAAEEELPVRERPQRPPVTRKRSRKEVRVLAEVDKEPHERAAMPQLDLDDTRVGRRAWGVLPYRTERGSILFPCNHPGGYAWAAEWKAARASHDGVRSHGGWALQSKCGCENPYAAIGHYYQLRIRWSTEGGQRDKPLKLGMNGCYGKIAQTIGDNPKYACRALAGHITAGTRARLLEAIAAAPDPWSVVYVATDGVISTTPIEPPNPARNETAAAVEELNRSLPEKKQKTMLGAWERRKYDEDLFVVQPGFYFSLSGEMARTRGTPLEVIESFMGEILRQWSERPTEKPRGLPQQSLFHGAKSSVRPPLGEGGRYRRKPEYGRWRKQDRIINYVVAPKRSDVLAAGDGRYRLSTWILRDGEAPSHDYRKDPMFAMQDELADEQPDFEEPLVRGVGE